VVIPYYFDVLPILFLIILSKINSISGVGYSRLCWHTAITTLLTITFYASGILGGFYLWVFSRLEILEFVKEVFNHALSKNGVI